MNLLQKILLFLIASSLIFSASFESIVTNITSQVSGTMGKSIFTLIVIAVGIYMMKNWERLKEVWQVCVVIVIGAGVVTNSRQIVEWFF